MAYTRVYENRTNWENYPSVSTPIDEINLNKMDYALNVMDGTLANWDITKAEQSDLLLSVKTIDYDPTTGIFIFTWQNGTTKTVDLNVEKIPVSFSMDANGVITMTTSDGTQYTADIGALIKLYTFVDSSIIDFTVTTDSSGNKTITADIIAGSITGDKLQPNYLADCVAAKQGAESAAGNASGSATAADNSAEDAEAWAKGTRNGEPVPSTDPAYENNSKYYAEEAAQSVTGVSSFNGRTGAVTPANGDYTKSMVGLGNVDNTSDLDKPVSTATATALGAKADTTDVNNLHKVTTFQVTSPTPTDWVTDTISQTGSTLYKKTITLNHVYAMPEVDIAAASGNTLPTTDEQAAYDLVQYVTVDAENNYLYLYASEIPENGFYIKVEGVD